MENYEILKFIDNEGELDDRTYENFSYVGPVIKKTCYSIGASLNYIGKKAFEISKTDDDNIVKTILDKIYI